MNTAPKEWNIKTTEDILAKLEHDIIECKRLGEAEYKRPPDCWLLFRCNLLTIKESPVGIPIAGFKTEIGLRTAFMQHYKGNNDICLVAYWLEE